MIWEISSEICCLPASIEFPALLFILQVIVQGNESESCVSPGQDGKEGELQVRGPSVFKW